MADAQKLIVFAPLILASAVVLVAFIDLRERRIPNLIIFPLTIIGVVLNALRGIDGVIFSLTGLAVGLGLLFIPYLLRVMGAGDVKFLAAIGTFVGGAGSVRVLLIALLIYPLIAFCFVIAQGKLKITLRRFTILTCNLIGAFIPVLKLYAERLKTMDDASISSAQTPFGLTLSIGTMLALFTNFLR